MPGQVLGGAVHHDVGAQRAGVAQEGAGHGVVDHQRHAMRMRHIGHRGDIQHHAARVAQGLGEHGACVGLHGCGKGGRIGGVDEARRDAELGQADRQHRDRAAVQRPGRDHMVAVGDKVFKQGVLDFLAETD